MQHCWPVTLVWGATVYAHYGYTIAVRASVLCVSTCSGDEG